MKRTPRHATTQSHGGNPEAFARKTRPKRTLVPSMLSRLCGLINFTIADIGACICSWTKPCGTSCLRCAHPALTMILRISWTHPMLRSTPVHLSSPRSEGLPQQQWLQVGLHQAGQGNGSSMSGQNPAITKAAATATVHQVQSVLHLCL